MAESLLKNVTRLLFAGQNDVLCQTMTNQMGSSQLKKWPFSGQEACGEGAFAICGC